MIVDAGRTTRHRRRRDRGRDRLRNHQAKQQLEAITRSPPATARSRAARRPSSSAWARSRSRTAAWTRLGARGAVAIGACAARGASRRRRLPRPRRGGPPGWDRAACGECRSARRGARRRGAGRVDAAGARRAEGDRAGGVTRQVARRDAPELDEVRPHRPPFVDVIGVERAGGVDVTGRAAALRFPREASRTSPAEGEIKARRRRRRSHAGVCPVARCRLHRSRRST